MHAGGKRSNMKLSNVALILVIIAFAIVIVMLDSCERKKREQHRNHPKGTDIASDLCFIISVSTITNKHP